MKAVVLVDNIEREDLNGEWGLSIYITYGEKVILLDVGSSELFLENAGKLGIDIKKADAAVLSHAHYDHANGMEAFFEVNKTAKFYLRKGSGENCYKRTGFKRKYIGLPKGITEKFPDRIEYAEGDYQLYEGVSLIPHKTAGLAAVGRKNHMYVKRGLWLYADDFSHEQSLVFQTPKGLVIFNSCSHAGADNIIREVSETYPNQKIYAIVGGFHLYLHTDEGVREFAKRVRDTGIERVYTGHCTGDRAYEILKEELGEMVEQLSTGLVIEF